MLQEEQYVYGVVSKLNPDLGLLSVSALDVPHLGVCIYNDTCEAFIVIQVSTRVDDQLRKECLAAGMDDLLSKPVTMSQLVTVLRTLRASRTNREPGQVPSRNASPNVVERPPQRKYSGTLQPDGPSKDAGSPLNGRARTPSHRKSRHKSSNSRQSMLRAALQRPSTTDVVPDASLTLALKVLIGAGQVQVTNRTERETVWCVLPEQYSRSLSSRCRIASVQGFSLFGLSRSLTLRLPYAPFISVPGVHA